MRLPCGIWSVRSRGLVMNLGLSLLYAAERSPTAEAVCDGEQRLNYLKLATTAHSLAQGLAANGVRRGDSVAMILSNRLEAVEIFWACQWLGAVIVPLSWRVSPQDVAYCVADSEARLVVFEEASVTHAIELRRELSVSASGEEDGSTEKTTFTAKRSELSVSASGDVEGVGLPGVGVGLPGVVEGMHKPGGGGGASCVGKAKASGTVKASDTGVTLSGHQAGWPERASEEVKALGIGVTLVGVGGATAQIPGSVPYESLKLPADPASFSVIPPDADPADADAAAADAAVSDVSSSVGRKPGVGAAADSAVSSVSAPAGVSASAGVRSSASIGTSAARTALCPPAADLDDRAPSIILYTSGTTGRPKGVPRSQSAERASGLSQCLHQGYEPGERTLGVMPFYHTMGVHTLLAAHLVGGCFVCMPSWDAEEALRLIEAERITSLFLAPTLFHDLVYSSLIHSPSQGRGPGSATRTRAPGELPRRNAPSPLSGGDLPGVSSGVSPSGAIGSVAELSRGRGGASSSDSSGVSPSSGPAGGFAEPSRGRDVGPDDVPGVPGFRGESPQGPRGRGVSPDDMPDLSSVRRLAYAGAAMTADLVERCSEVFAPDLFVNHYGSTEVYTYSIHSDQRRSPGCAGLPAVNARLRLVRPEAGASPSEEVPTGEVGEIICHLSSPEAFGGYHNRPDADAKSIRDGWFFTGDLGCKDAEGNLWIVGRIDDMIVSGGENIHPLEVEEALVRSPDVLEAAVVGTPDARLGAIVTAFVVPAAMAAADVAAGMDVGAIPYALPGSDGIPADDLAIGAVGSVGVADGIGTSSRNTRTGEVGADGPVVGAAGAVVGVESFEEEFAALMPVPAIDPEGVVGVESFEGELAARLDVDAWHGRHPRVSESAEGELAARLDAFCLAEPSLARFKRPRRYHFVESLPKSPSGKILRRKLREHQAANTRKEETSP